MKEKLERTKGLLYSSAEQLAIDYINSFESLDAFIEEFPEQKFSRATLSVLKSSKNNHMPEPVRKVLLVMGMNMKVQKTQIFILYKDVNEPQAVTYDKALSLALNYLNQYPTLDEFIKAHSSRGYVKQTLALLRSKSDTALPKVVQDILIDAGYIVSLNKDHLFTPID